MGFVLMIVFAGPWIALFYAAWSPNLGSAQGEVPGVLEYGINPLRSLWFCSFSWSELVTAIERDPDRFFTRLGCALLGMLIYASLAYLFWLLAALQFRDVEK